jgi:signal transduction histidine kinase
VESLAPPLGGKLALDAKTQGRRRTAPPSESFQESALAALHAVSASLDSDGDVTAFFGCLSATVAEHLGAGRAAFWRMDPRGTLSLQPAPFGFADESPVYGARLQLGTRGAGVLERLLFADDLELVKGTSTELDMTWHAAGVEGVTNSIAASWRAGERRIGAVAVYDAEAGFTAQDLWVLRLIGAAAGLLWQYREAEDDLAQTALRLEEAMEARRHLLNNIAAGGDEARRRFASALHDDSLQLLTGAELQLERIRAEVARAGQTVKLEQLRLTLRKVEDSLRRLLSNVSPEPVELPGDLWEAISERLESLRLHAGIEGHIEGHLPADVPPAIRGIVMKNVGEALSNVEKHARATRVTVVAEELESGIRIEVRDDGTGFVVAESIRLPGHIGLVAVRERAQLAGGWCRVETEPGTGTRLAFWVPLAL